MVSTQVHAQTGVLWPPGRRLNTPGVMGSDDLTPFRKLAKARRGVDRGQTIVGRMGSVKQFTILLEGIACLSDQHENGNRQIHTFYYPGDFLGLHGFLFPQSGELSEVQALTNCSIGTIDRDVVDQEIQRHPAQGRALWRAAFTEMSIFRQRLLTSRQPALQRVAHLLCEQMARLEIDEGVIPLSQIDVADAAGLSVVHTNRIFQELRQLGMLSKQRALEVVDKERLEELAAFDGRYLNPSESLSRWDLRIED
jgi:CRP-like cAMP-binding protein